MLKATNFNVAQYLHKDQTFVRLKSSTGQILACKDHLAPLLRNKLVKLMIEEDLRLNSEEKQDLFKL